MSGHKCWYNVLNWYYFSKVGTWVLMAICGIMVIYHSFLYSSHFLGTKSPDVYPCVVVTPQPVSFHACNHLHSKRVGIPSVQLQYSHSCLCTSSMHARAKCSVWPGNMNAWRIKRQNHNFIKFQCAVFLGWTVAIQNRKKDKFSLNTVLHRNRT